MNYLSGHDFRQMAMRLGLIRKTDPDTSVKAAEEIYPNLTKIQAEVMRFAKLFPRGFTDEYMNEYFGTYKSTYRSRRSELVKKGLIVDSGRVENKMTVWVLKEYANDQ